MPWSGILLTGLRGDGGRGVMTDIIMSGYGTHITDKACESPVQFRKTNSNSHVLSGKSMDF